MRSRPVALRTSLIDAVFTLILKFSPIFLRVCLHPVCYLLVCFLFGETSPTKHHFREYFHHFIILPTPPPDFTQSLHYLQTKGYTTFSRCSGTKFRYDRLLKSPKSCRNVVINSNRLHSCVVSSKV